MKTVGGIRLTHESLNCHEAVGESQHILSPRQSRFDDGDEVLDEL